MIASDLRAACRASSNFFLPDVLIPSLRRMIARRVLSGAGPSISSDVTHIASQMAVDPAVIWLSPEIGGVPATTPPPIYPDGGVIRTLSIECLSRVRLFVIPCSRVDSPVNEMTATSSFDGLITVSRNDIAAAFSSGSVRSCERLVSIRIARLSGRSTWRENATISCGLPSSSRRTSSCLRVVSRRRLRSCAVNNTFTTSVSTLMISSSSSGSGGVAVGTADAGAVF